VLLAWAAARAGQENRALCPSTMRILLFIQMPCIGPT
jgi:hypothetical protein